MKRTALALPLIVILLFVAVIGAQPITKANPMYTSIPPKVTVPEMNVNATISKVNGLFWVAIDAEYQMHTIYGYGDSYIAQNTGMGSIADPSPYVTVTVTQDILEAHYPIPFNVTSLSVNVNGEKAVWQQDSRGFFHIFDSDLLEINWTVAPVPNEFVVAVHYEHPILKTDDVYSYLGDYAFVLPLYGRYGCSNISFPLYSWFGYVPREYNIQIESGFTETEAYSISTRGTLAPLKYNASTEKGVERIEISQETEEDTFFHGAVVVFNTPISSNDNPAIRDGYEPIFIGIISVLVTVVVIGLLLYFKKRRVVPRDKT